MLQILSYISSNREQLNNGRNGVADGLVHQLLVVFEPMITISSPTVALSGVKNNIRSTNIDSELYFESKVEPVTSGTSCK